MNTYDPDPIVISGIGPMTPIATTIEELAATKQQSDQATTGRGRDWFDAQHFLGQRGFKYLTPATRYVLAATQLAFQDARIEDVTFARHEKGVLIGTNFGVSAVHQRMDEVIMSMGASALSPMDAANFSINLPASYVSIKHGLQAFNITCTSPTVAAIEALMVGAQALRRGQARMVVVGATEDQPPSTFEEVVNGSRDVSGACVFVLERLSSARKRQAFIYAEFGRGTLRFIPPMLLEEEETQHRLSVMLTNELERLVLPHQTVVHYSALTCSHPTNRIVDRIVRSVLAARKIRVINTEAVGADGSFMTVSPLLQLGASLLIYGAGLLLTTSPYGHITLLNLQPFEGRK